MGDIEFDIVDGFVAMEEFGGIGGYLFEKSVVVVGLCCCCLGGEGSVEG